MKRITALVLASVMLLALAACGGTKQENPGADMPVLDVLTEIMSSVETEFMAENMMLDEENFEYFAFIPYKDGFEAAVNESMIGAIAHSVVLVRVPDGEDAGAVADEIKANADPRKWICVEAEKTEVLQAGNLVLLVMSATTVADAVISSFNSFCESK